MDIDGSHPVRNLTGLAPTFLWSRFPRDSQEVLKGQDQNPNQDLASETELPKDHFNNSHFSNEQIMNNLRCIMRLFSFETGANKYCIPVLVSQVYSEEINFRMFKSFP